jgi:hypothetical protein
MAAMGAALIGLLLFSMEGLEWFRQYAYNTYGYFIKSMVFLFLGLTAAGMLPIAYWTGRALAIKLGMEPWFDGEL